MKKLFTLFVFLPIICLGQKQGNIWYFGIQAGLNFTSGSPVILSGGQTGTDVPLGYNQEGTACISDSLSNILLYTGGITIWNRNHNPMPNGTGIMGGTSSTQSSLIVPLPGSDSIFYVFTTDEFQGFNSHPPHKGYRYSVVNMCLDGGKGDVISGQKNILLCDSSTEKLTACEDANGNGYWIVGHKMFSNKFYSWHLTSSGISNTVISSIGTIHGWHIPNSTWQSGSAQGQMKLNASGTKLALAISNFDPAYLDLFDFNNNTGVVSNFCHMVIDSVLNMRIFGVEFSSDGSKLYATLAGGSGKHRIYQFDMNAGGGNCDSIIASRFKLAQLYNYGTSGIQIAPNNKIYVVVSNSNLGCINFPNSSGFAANFDSLAITCGNTGNYMIPSFVAGYKYHNELQNCSNTSIEKEIFNLNISVFPNPFSTRTFIQIDKVLKNATLKIYNSFGCSVKQISNISEQIITLNRDNLPCGLYFMRLTQNNKCIASDKIIITDD